MSAGSVLAENAAGLVGFNQKAKLVIYNDTKKSLSQSAVTAKASEALGNTGTGGSTATSVLKSSFHEIQVQFNPSSIRFEANSTPVNVKYLQDNFDPTIPNMQSRKESIVLMVDLIFDAVSNKDAFHGDKFRISLSDAAALAGTAVKELTGGYSVQKQTNGLIAAIMRESTRVISFTWAKMIFTGVLQEVRAKYTMFSPGGNPIRSVVTLSLKQTMTPGENAIWDKAFSSFFGEPGVDKGLISGKSTLQDIQKFINIGI
ncbi:MAG: hypothetical protein FWG44_02215 [Oscillospiraceae bacterium]|nr:hypothetical protein [Oscillospiraceae bacterium]